MIDGVGLKCDGVAAHCLLWEWCPMLILHSLDQWNRALNTGAATIRDDRRVVHEWERSRHVAAIDIWHTSELFQTGFCQFTRRCNTNSLYIRYMWEREHKRRHCETFFDKWSCERNCTTKTYHIGPDINAELYYANVVKLSPKATFSTLTSPVSGSQPQRSQWDAVITQNCMDFSF